MPPLAGKGRQWGYSWVEGRSWNSGALADRIIMILYSGGQGVQEARGGGPETVVVGGVWGGRVLKNNTTQILLLRESW